MNRKSFVLDALRRCKLQIIEVYLTTIIYSDEVIESFCADVASMNHKGICYIKLIIGDWNARTRTKNKSEKSECKKKCRIHLKMLIKI